MNPNKDTIIGLGLLLGVGGASFFYHVTVGEPLSSDLLTAVFGRALPMLLSVTVIGIGLWMYREGYQGSELKRIGGWCVGSFGVLSALGYVFALYRRQLGGDGLALWTEIINTATAGAVIGLLIGYYEIQNRRTVAKLRQERKEKERQAERLAVLNRVLRHDMRNDVNVIRGYTKRIIDGFDDLETAATVIENRTEDLLRLSKKSRKIEDLLGGEVKMTERIDIADILREKIDQVRTEYVGVEIQTDLPSQRFVRASPLIESAVDNVIENAIRHNDQEVAELEIVIRETTVERQPMVEIRFIDNGPGIPQNEIELHKERDVTQLQHSSGMGLWVTRWIVEEADGTMELEHADHRGSVVRLHLDPDCLE